MREDSLVPSSMVTPQKPGSCIENALHKDVFGVISGTGEWLLNLLEILVKSLSVSGRDM